MNDLSTTIMLGLTHLYRLKAFTNIYPYQGVKLFDLQLARRFTFILLFFLNHTATTEIYTLSLHDALPISSRRHKTLRGHRGRATRWCGRRARNRRRWDRAGTAPARDPERRSAARRRSRLRPCGPSRRSEEHTSELQSLTNLVCRLLLEKKKKLEKTPPRSECVVTAAKVRRAMRGQLSDALTARPFEKRKSRLLTSLTESERA